MLREALAKLAALTGQTVVDAATNDTRKTFRHELDSLLGRGFTSSLSYQEERLEWTRRARLTGREGADLEKARFAVAWEWTRRLVDLGNPGGPQGRG